MSKKILKGLSNVTIFPITANTKAAYTVGTGVPIPGAQSMGIAPQVSEWKVYADDTVYESGRDWNGMTVTFQVAELSIELKEHFEGGTWDAANKTYTFKETDIAPEIGLSFAASTSDGEYRMVKILALRTTTVSGEFTTKGEGGDNTNPITITATATSRAMDGAVKIEKDSEDGVLTWLNTLADSPGEG